MTSTVPPERMPRIPADKMTPAQKKVAADIAAGPRGEMRGPFIALLRSPGLAGPVQQVGEYLRFNCPLEKRIIEFAALIAARRWTQQYEWQAHHPHALAAGVKPALLEAVAEGRRPAGMASDEEIVHDMLTELFDNHCVCDATYGGALKQFGEEGVVDIIGIAGYYALLAMVMNVARTGLPAGKEPPLPHFPR